MKKVLIALSLIVAFALQGYSQKVETFESGKEIVLKQLTQETIQLVAK